VPEELEVLKRIESELHQLLKWTRLAGLQQLKIIISQSLTSDKELAAYELSDGERTTRDIAKLAKIGSNATVANYWKKWSLLGIVEPSEKRQGRFQKIVSLQEVGLSLPPLLETSEEVSGQPKAEGLEK
jgi:hypothetical protein